MTKRLVRLVICFGYAILLLLWIACQKTPREESTITDPIPFDITRQENKEDNQDTNPEPLEVTEITKPPKSGIALRFSPPIGLRWKLKISATIEVESLENPPIESKFQITYSGVVKSKSDNITTIETTISPFTVKMPQGETNFKEESSEIKVNNMGKVLTTENDILSGLLGVGIIPFPKGKITTGSRWKTTTIRTIPTLAEFEAEEEYQLSDIKLLSGKKYALINGKVRSITNTLVADFDYLIDLSTGIIQSGNINQAVQIKDGHGTTVTRLKIMTDISTLSLSP